MPLNYSKHSNKAHGLNKEIALLIKSLKKERQRRFGFWEKAVGEKISEIAVPYRVKNEILLVRVSDSVWRFELTKRKEELLEKVNENAKSKIKDIIFK
jgi:predicted nucleic acid-binding Zn ribbon protein